MLREVGYQPVQPVAQRVSHPRRPRRVERLQPVLFAGVLLNHVVVDRFWVGCCISDREHVPEAGLGDADEKCALGLASEQRLGLATGDHAVKPRPHRAGLVLADTALLLGRLEPLDRLVPPKVVLGHHRPVLLVARRRRLVRVRERRVGDGALAPTAAFGAVRPPDLTPRWRGRRGVRHAVFWRSGRRGGRVGGTRRLRL
mmetsp:Transcript_18924/g.49248  ORF Transcript_18924/g.49248 Transcript_18924/m.49248 type:complete len:200 (-) Transcript_18924:51-650(-)